MVYTNTGSHALYEFYVKSINVTVGDSRGFVDRVADDRWEIQADLGCLFRL